MGKFGRLQSPAPQASQHIRSSCIGAILVKPYSILMYGGHIGKAIFDSHVWGHIGKAIFDSHVWGHIGKAIFDSHV